MTDKFEPTIRVATDIPISTVELLDKYAAEMSLKRSQAVRTLVKLQLEQMKH